MLEAPQKRIIPIDKQIAIIKETTDLTAYAEVHRLLGFEVGSLGSFAGQVYEHTGIGPEMYRLETAVAFQIAALPFGSMAGRFSRHTDRDHNFQKSPLSLEHVCAVLTYNALLEQLSRPIKRQWRAELAGDKEAVLGVSQVFYSSRNGRTTYPENLSLEGKRKKA